LANSSFVAAARREMWNSRADDAFHDETLSARGDACPRNGVASELLRGVSALEIPACRV